MTSENNTNFKRPSCVLHSPLVVATLQQTSVQTSIQTKMKTESEQKKSTSLEGSNHLDHTKPHGKIICTIYIASFLTVCLNVKSTKLLYY